MKLMTYNILDGGGDLDAVLETVINEAPDFLTINEANDFELDDQKKLKEFASKGGFEYFHLALSGEYDYHVAIFSKFPLKEVHEIHPLMRAGISVVVDTKFGEVCIIGTHLTPYNEDSRLSEVKRIVQFQQKYEHKILMGDMNALADSDGHSSNLAETFNEKQKEKFTSEGKVRFDVLNYITSTGYVDTAVELKGNKTSTVPTPSNEDPFHSELRLDYIFVSNSLKKHLTNYSVIKDTLTDTASDHYPVVVSLE